MFVIVHNGSVILGPMVWNRKRFQDEIEEECGVTTTLPYTNEGVITVNEDIKIYPVQTTQDPPFNSKIEFLNGPFWEFTETHAVSSYIAQDKPISAVQNELKALAAQERWKKEISGVKVTIQSTEITADTNRGDRDIFIQQYLLMGESDTVMWKFPEAWLELTKTELGTIVGTGAYHVKQAFVWEQDLSADIDACATLSELDALVIVESSEQQ